MPPGKRRQSNAMLYTLMTFVGLFIIATTAAVVYYVKAEELRTRADEAERELSTVASSSEISRMGDIVGERSGGQTNLGTMVEHLDRVVGLATGTPVPPGNAEVKASSVARAASALLDKARSYLSLPGASDPNAPPVALTTLVSGLLDKLQNTLKEKQAVQNQLKALQTKFTDATQIWQETEEGLTAKVAEYRTLVEQTKADYNDLRVLVTQRSDDRVASLLNQLEEERAQTRQLNQEMAKTQDQLHLAQQRLGDALTQVNKIQPPPDHEAEAQEPDGRILLVDDIERLVTINLGSDDKVYRGLTFSVYDNLGGIPRDGKPKGEIEIFAIDRKVSTARILSSQERNPISTNDLVANLIWNSDKVNHFVIAGDFDLNSDGTPEYDADASIASLIGKWGGVTDNTVTAQTDFVILGTKPRLPPEPTFEDLAANPMARERYDSAKQRQERYEEIRQQAQALYIPVFAYQRFLYFTGYETAAGKPGAF
ncbi:MAG: hypothetical protein JW993_09415 [Sedimentisphaerales bacterium]|nr:hypothetical protein [Sedimentisphaerales bacterium]